MVRTFVLWLALSGRAQAASAVESLVESAPGCDAGRATCIGLSLHIAVGDEGPVATADWLSGQLAAANQHFARLDVGFQVVAVDALPTTATRIRDREQRSALGRQVKGTVIHVFVTGRLDDIDVAGGVIYGVTWPRGETKFVILSTAAWPRTLAHELGHVFGLPHSRYAISIMNKTDRDEPPIDQRTFADEELKAMKPRLAALLRARAIVGVMPR